MHLNIELKIIFDENVKHLYLQDYNSNISSDGPSFAFDLKDFDKAAYAQKILNEEFTEAIKRTDKRLLAEGFDKNNFQIPRWERKEYENSTDSDKS